LIALITGAGSGIGKEIALYLSELGYELYIVGRNKDKLSSVKDSLRTKTNIIVCDLSDPSQCYKLHDSLKNIEINVLINNAGFGVFGDFSTTSLEDELKMIDVNIKAVHILTKLFLNDFKKRKTGFIMNVSSSAGFMMGPLFSSYYASKSYVLRLTQAIHRELIEEKSAVRISALCPGPVKTDFDKVAGVNTSLKGLDSKFVAKYAVDKMLKGKTLIIPGFTMKLSVVFSKFVPWKLLSKITYLCQKKKK